MNQSIEKRDTFYLYRKELIRLIGKTKIFKLQQSLPLVDAFLCFLIISAFLINGFFLATLLIGIVWLALFILQGFIIQWFPFFAHDAFIHRKVGGKNIAYIGSILFMLPVFISPTAYREKHLKHHFYLNTAKDTEEYKLDLNSRWKKLFFLTFLGLNIITSRFLPNKNNQNPIQVEEIDTNKTIEINKRINNEKIILIFFLFSYNIALFGF